MSRYNAPLWDFSNVLFLSGPFAEYFYNRESPYEIEDRIRAEERSRRYDILESNDVRIRFTVRVINVIDAYIAERSKNGRLTRKEKSRLLEDRYCYSRRLAYYRDTLDTSYVDEVDKLVFDLDSEQLINARKDM